MKRAQAVVAKMSSSERHVDRHHFDNHSVLSESEGNHTGSEDEGREEEGGRSDSSARDHEKNGNAKEVQVLGRDLGVSSEASAAKSSTQPVDAIKATSVTPMGS